MLRDEKRRLRFKREGEGVGGIPSIKCGGKFKFPTKNVHRFYDICPSENEFGGSGLGNFPQNR